MHRFFASFLVASLPRFGRQNGAQMVPIISDGCPKRGSWRALKGDWPPIMVLPRFCSALASHFGRIFVRVSRHPHLTAGALWLATAFFFLSQRCQELVQNLPTTWREPMPKISAAERRPVNCHLPSCLHGATATVDRRPNTKTPSIKMRGRRCPPLGVRIEFDFPAKDHTF